MRQKYFDTVFGSAGTITPAIPDAADPNGYVSYSVGFTFDYQRNLLTDPAAKSPTYINFNAILSDVTGALQALQQQGVPEFITSAQNGGTAFSYRQNALVAYSASGTPPFSIYMSAIDNNTDVPGTTANWINLQKSAGVAVVGETRNAAMVIAAASATATFTADEVVVENALGGSAYKLSAFNETINLATVGTGGMDAGTPTASWYIALYAIYNPSTGAAGILASNCAVGGATSVYSGGHIPAGYTMSALISVWPTNGSGQLISGAQSGRNIAIPLLTMLNTTTQKTTLTALSISAGVPPNAKTVALSLSISDSIATSNTRNIVVASDANGSGQIQSQFGMTSSTGANGGSSGVVLLATPQEIFYTATTTSGGTGTTFNIGVSGYTI